MTRTLEGVVGNMDTLPLNQMGKFASLLTILVSSEWRLNEVSSTYESCVELGHNDKSMSNQAAVLRDSLYLVEIN